MPYAISEHSLMIPLLPQDRGRLDPKNVPALVVDEKDGCKYQLATIFYWS